jgi:hypothetical protein
MLYLQQQTFINSGINIRYDAVTSQFTLQCQLKLEPGANRKTVVSSSEEKVRQLLTPTLKYCDS